MRKKDRGSKSEEERPSKSTPFRVHEILRTLFTDFFDFSAAAFIVSVFSCSARAAFSAASTLFRAAAVSSVSVVVVCPVVAVEDWAAASDWIGLGVVVVVVVVVVAVAAVVADFSDVIAACSPKPNTYGLVDWSQS